MSFLSVPWKTRSILIWLTVHFSLWWIVSAFLWIRGYGAIAASLLAPVAPIYYGIVYLWFRSLVAIAIGSLFITGALVGFTLHAVENNKPWVTLLTHVLVFLYWCASFVLIGAGA